MKISLEGIKHLDSAAEKKRLLYCKKNWLLGTMPICINTINAFYFEKLPRGFMRLVCLLFTINLVWLKGSH